MQDFQSIFSKVGFINNIKIFPYVKIVYFKVYHPTPPHLPPSSNSSKPILHQGCLVFKRIIQMSMAD